MSEQSMRSSPAESAPAFVIGNWYALRIGGNRERKVKAELQPLVPEVLLPTTIDRNRVRRQRTALLYLPGFVFLRSVLTDELYHAVHKIRGVVGFAGTVYLRKVSGRMESYVHPARIPDRQMQKLLDLMDADGVIERVTRLPPNLKDELLRVIGGPFSGFNGECVWHDAERGRLKVNVSMFGRMVPIPLDEEAVELLA